MRQKYVELWGGPADGFALRVPFDKSHLFVATHHETHAFRVIEDGEEVGKDLIGLYKESLDKGHLWRWDGYEPLSSLSQVSGKV